MALSSTRQPKLRISKSLTRFRFRSLSIRSKPISNMKETDQKVEFLNRCPRSFSDQDESMGGNKVMVVVDLSSEAKGAVDWALSHAIQSQDTIVLLYVTKSSRQGNLRVNLQAYELLQSMKSLCQKKKPGVGVETVLQESREKGPTIVEEAKQQKVSLLILGQKKRSIFWWLITKRWWVGKSYGGGSVEYCIQNASCMTIAVRRKNKRLGGYLITTKRHKNFWLLA